MKKLLKDSVLTILNEAIIPPHKIDFLSWMKSSQRDNELKLLSEAVKYERFFFIVDSINQSIQFSKGIKQWLGYEDDDFSLNLYTSIIHEHHINAFLVLTNAIAYMAKNRQIDLSFMQGKITIEIALKHAKGHYLIVKQALSCWDFNENYQIPIAYINEFTIWKEYDDETSAGINLRVIDATGRRLKSLEEVVRKNVSHILEKEKYFSVQELRFLRKYAYNHDITTHEIALVFKVSYNTANVYNRRIVEKFASLYPDQKIKMAKEVALFLRKENFI